MDEMHSERRYGKMSETDLISRHQAIDALKQIGSIDTNADREYAEKVFMALPSAQQWIPVSEALPEISKFVIVTDSNGLIEIACRMHEWDAKNNNIGRKIIWWVRDYYGAIQATAWMPLPEPYKGGEHGNNT